MKQVLRVSSKSTPASVAGAVAGYVRSGDEVVLDAVGAAAVNQAVKSLAIARGMLLSGDVEMSFVPTFQTIEIDGADRTAIRFAVEAWEENDETPSF